MSALLPPSPLQARSLLIKVSRSDGRPDPGGRSEILSKALERFRTELDDGDSESLVQVSNAEELIAQINSLQHTARSSQMTRSMSRLEPILAYINDFAALIALFSGTDPKATGLVWGSLRMILAVLDAHRVKLRIRLTISELATPAEHAFDGILAMLDEISLSLPRFRTYEETLPMNHNLESALIDVYAEMICVYARTIKFFRHHPHSK